MRNIAPKLKRIMKRGFKPTENGRLQYSGNQNRPGWVYHPTKGWRRSRPPLGWWIDPVVEVVDAAN